MIGYLVPTTSPHLATSAQSHRNPHPTLSSPFPSCPHAPRPPNCSRDIIRTGSDCCQLSTRKQTHQSYHRFTSYSRSVVSQPKSRADWSATFTEGVRLLHLGRKSSKFWTMSFKSSVKDKLRTLFGRPPKPREPGPPPSSQQSNLSSLAPGNADGQSASTSVIVLPCTLHEPRPTSTTANTTPDSAQILRRSRSVSSSYHAVAACVETPPTATQPITSTAPLPSVTIASELTATAITASTDSGTACQSETKEAPPSLWHEALCSLEESPEHRILLENCVGEDVHRITSSIEENIRIERERKGKEWKIPFLGDVIVMKEIVMKTLRWVHRFREATSPSNTIPYTRRFPGQRSDFS